MTTDIELTDRARAVARTLTYNDDTPQAQAKHTLLELAHRLDARVVQASKKRDGLLLRNALGQVRYATWRERLAFRLFGVLPAGL